MAAMAPDGAAQAINLTGLTLKGEMDMALRIGQYRYATTILLTLSESHCGSFLKLSALLLCTPKMKSLLSTCNSLSATPKAVCSLPRSVA